MHVCLPARPMAGHHGTRCLVVDNDMVVDNVSVVPEASGDSVRRWSRGRFPNNATCKCGVVGVIESRKSPERGKAPLQLVNQLHLGVRDAKNSTISLCRSTRARWCPRTPDGPRRRHGGAVGAAEAQARQRGVRVRQAGKLDV